MIQGFANPCLTTWPRRQNQAPRKYAPASSLSTPVIWLEPTRAGGPAEKLLGDGSGGWRYHRAIGPYEQSLSLSTAVDVVNTLVCGFGTAQVGGLWSPS